ncbi:malonyl-CoA decarboxylase [Novosphingobium chloroacetimidivorans]|uniref:Malonyl-CoA decarboxylase n=1 Tax=Novosphingobium chloroacetimidivorans TaxID=1428314 RepID=A0A7W7K829_9SPHN|nr:malonyl-CoA decarboxylase [Novosphingobium chloroacetimidivorans]MBB4857984.1 malonyl-CoA decarboxylase [Novosphingobium chloroacetimidivorans]
MNTARTRTQADAPVRRRSALDLLMNSGLGKMLRGLGVVPRQENEGESLLDLADALLSLRGRASGPAVAKAFFDLYEASDIAARQEFLGKIHGAHPVEGAAIEKAIAKWAETHDEGAARALHEATESPSQKLIRVLNLAPQGTERLIGMREDLLAAPKSPSLSAFDRDLEGAFTNWFNAGFLELRRISWDSPACLLERIIRYEAVHQIQGWDDLRRRVEPIDRRCYGFFHPQMMDDPLIFVEVALTQELPSAIHQIIAEKRETVDPGEASCAIFYSINNCRTGLKGIPFGNYLIKRVVGLLQQELPQLKTFATLSPVPGFAKWLAKQDSNAGKVPGAKELRVLGAKYLVDAKGKGGQPLDPVARFHLGNGARLEAIHANADLSENGQRQAHGIMVNYVYDLADIEANHFALTELGTVVTSKAVQALVEDTEPKEGKEKKGKKKDKDKAEPVAA